MEKKKRSKINFAGIMMILVGLTFLIFPFIDNGSLVLEKVVAFIVGLILYGGGWRFLKD
jgi:uncharacterized membrane protein HdeD (DUF308 family)